jgi:hypothetical protein
LGGCYDDDVTYQDLLKRLHDHPFKPFRVRLSNHTSIDVTDPGLVSVGETTAIMPEQVRQDEDGYTFVKRWRTVSLDHIAEFIDINGKGNGGGKRRRSGKR